MLGAFAAIVVFGLFFAGGYALVSSLSAKEKPNVKTLPSKDSAAQQPTASGAFQETVAQANETQTKERKASTKFEWVEIGNHYKRAALLLGSIDQTNPDYSQAQTSSLEFQIKTHNAFSKAKEIERNAASTANNNSATTISTGYPPDSNSAIAPTPLEFAKMPAPRREKSYLVFDSSEGDYIGKRLDWAFTSRESRFTANGFKR